MSALGNAKVHKLTLSYADTGDWRAEVWLDEGAQAPQGEQVLMIGDVEFRGHVTRGALDRPDLPHAVHVGAPGWDIEATSPIAYQSDVGVRLSTVLRDLATRAGQAIELPGDVVLGPAWSVVATRPGSPLRIKDALAALARGRYVGPYRVDPDGVTRFGARIGVEADGGALNVLRRNSAAGYAVVGADAFASILPGNLFEGATISRLVINEQPENLEAELWTRAPSMATSILRKVGDTFPSLIYGHPRTYRVGAVGGDGRLDLEPPQDAPHLPRLARVDVWGLGGAQVTPLVGSLAVVVFRDANPGRPIVIALEPLRASTPAAITLDAAALDLGAAFAPVLRSGDYVALDTITTPGRTRIALDGLGAPAPAASKVKA